MRVLVTGARGHVATLARAGLGQRHDLSLVDVRAQTAETAAGAVHGVDLLRASDDELRPLFDGVEVVVHSAYVPSGATDVYSASPPQLDRLETELDNVRMAGRVYQHALQAGCRRVVVVSSNHAGDWYEHMQVHARRRELVGPGDLPLSDNFYGWSKAAYELLGHPFAAGALGRALEVVLLRIGSPYPIHPERYAPGAPPPKGDLPRPTGAAGFKRALGAFLSDRDCGQLFRRAVEVERVVPQGQVPWVVVYGISDNTRAFWSLQSARDALGYAPQDDSEVLYADAVRELLADSVPGRLGGSGPFLPAYGIGGTSAGLPG